MDWLRYSGIWLTLVVNPFHWQFQWFRNEHPWVCPAPNRSEYTAQFLFLSIRLTVDDGAW
jgi:hypothetical protein